MGRGASDGIQNAAAILTGDAYGLGGAAAGCKVAILDMNIDQGEKVAAAIGGRGIDAVNETQVASIMSSSRAIKQFFYKCLFTYLNDTLPRPCCSRK